MPASNLIAVPLLLLHFDRIVKSIYIQGFLEAQLELKYLRHPCRFHGIEPSKKSKEKIQRKVRDEMAAKKAATSEQPAGTLNHLKHAQVQPPVIKH